MAEKTWHIDDLPNPHLALTMPGGFSGIDHGRSMLLKEYPLAYGADWDLLSREAKRGLIDLRTAHLDAAHLPRDYDSLNDAAKLEARKQVLSSWYDSRDPGELVSNVDNLIAALYLWVEEYEKACRYTRGFYFRRDPKTKYELVRMMMSPPKVPSEPAKTVAVMPRSTTKTVTVIRQLCKMMAIVRPYTKILISEINEDRTKEEMGTIRDDLLNNELIHRDFGGPGKLFPKRSGGGKTFNEKVMDFLLYPGCSIHGYSLMSAQQGRHPIFGVIDDPEDENTNRDQEFRRKFFGNLFGRYLGMFYRGGKIGWMGTNSKGACISIALRGISEEVNDLDEVAEVLDTRFNSWIKFKMGMLRVDADGNTESIMPDHVSVDDYEARVASLGEVVAAAQLDGDPIGYGGTAFIRDTHRHGYMHCQRTHGTKAEEYFLDLHTGEEKPWAKFLEEIEATAAVDCADSTASDADFGACCVIGVNPAGKVFVLDQYNKRLISDEWPETGFQMADEWDAGRIGFDIAAMQNFVLRHAKRIRMEWEEQGRTPPMPYGVPHENKKKVHRILGTLRPLFRRNLIAFPHLSEIKLSDGTVHTPVRHPNRDSLHELKRQIDGFTDEGAAGHDDAADSLEMAVRLAGNRRGKKAIPNDPREAMVHKFAKIGAQFSPVLIPPEMWTEEMLEANEPDLPPAETSRQERRREFYDPYD